MLALSSININLCKFKVVLAQVICQNILQNMLKYYPPKYYFEIYCDNNIYFLDVCMYVHFRNEVPAYSLNYRISEINCMLLSPHCTNGDKRSCCCLIV